MKQLTQKLSNGEMLVQDVPDPVLGKGMILVKNHFSLISAGTEGNTAVTARKSLIGKAKERPQQVKQVLEVLAQQGPIQTYRAITKKLEAYSPMGYSTSGEVIMVSNGITEFCVGDKVACAGVGYANHAEIVAVPINLAVKLEKDADLKSAAYNTVGAISLEAIRLADLKLGESCAVIGLGLLGQLSGIMLRASGVRVVGIDINPSIVNNANENCADLALLRNTDGIEEIIKQFSDGLGVDAVIIAAASNSIDPINFAGAIARKKGKVVILGAVPTGFDRDPFWYRKELELKMSCSYGPGRYDINYEEKGIDYPAPYVRWTEKRNMQAFQRLLIQKTIKLDYLTTHEFDLKDAPSAYDMIVNKLEPYLGIILKYDISANPVAETKIYVNNPGPIARINVGFIGAGSYAQSNLLPNLTVKDVNIAKKGIIANHGTTSKRVTERFGFEFCTSEINDLIKNPDINTLFITTRHDTHCEYVTKSFSEGKNVFVEKPLCLNSDELDNIINVYKNSIGVQLMVGYNRRFSILSHELKDRIGEGPMTMIYRINAGKIDKESWIQDMELGGGRVIGEVCHFIDYLMWLNGSLPLQVYASSLTDVENKNDNITINLTFMNGSIGVISYYSNGSKLLPKEYIEVYHNGATGIIENFKELRFYSSKKYRKKLFNQDKGQAEMIRLFFESIISGKTLMNFDEIVAVSKASFAALESIKTGMPVSVNC